MEVNGTRVLQTTAAKVFGEEEPFTIQLTIGEITENPLIAFEGIDDLTSTISFAEPNSLVTFIYTDTNSSFTLGRLVVEQYFPDRDNELICNETSSLPSASITCSLLGLNGSFIGFGSIERSPGVIVEIVNFFISEAKDIFGGEGLFLSIFIILVAFFAFIWNPTAGIVALNVAVIFVQIIGFATFGMIYIFSMLSISLLLIMFLNT